MPPVVGRNRAAAIVGATPVAVIRVSLFTTNAGECGLVRELWPACGALSMVVYVTVQSSESAELVSRMRMVPLKTEVGSQLITRVPMLKAIPDGQCPIRSCLYRLALRCATWQPGR